MCKFRKVCPRIYLHQKPAFDTYAVVLGLGCSSVHLTHTQGGSEVGATNGQPKAGVEVKQISCCTLTDFPS